MSACCVSPLAHEDCVAKLARDEEAKKEVKIGSEINLKVIVLRLLTRPSWPTPNGGCKRHLTSTAILNDAP
jgi:hypothetical protein